MTEQSWSKAQSWFSTSWPEARLWLTNSLTKEQFESLLLATVPPLTATQTVETLKVAVEAAERCKLSELAAALQVELNKAKEASEPKHPEAPVEEDPKPEGPIEEPLP